MSDTIKSPMPEGFDQEKCFYEMGAIVMAEQERFISEQTDELIHAAESLHIEAVRANRHAIEKTSLIALGAVVVGGVVLNSILDALIGKNKSR